MKLCIQPSNYPSLHLSLSLPSSSHLFFYCFLFPLSPSLSFPSLHSFFPSFHPPIIIHLPGLTPIHPLIYPSIIHPSIHLPVHPSSIHPRIHASTHPSSIHPFTYKSIHLSIHQSMLPPTHHPSTHQCVHPPIHSPTNHHPPTNPSIHPSIQAISTYLFNHLTEEQTEIIY